MHYYGVDFSQVSSHQFRLVNEPLGVGEAAFCSLAPVVIDDASPAGRKSSYLGNPDVGQCILLTLCGIRVLFHVDIRWNCSW